MALLFAVAMDLRAATPVEGSAEVVTNALSVLSGRARGELQTVNVYFRDAQLRIDFVGARGGTYSLVRPTVGGPFLLLDTRGGAIPLPGHDFPLVFDPVRPSSGMGLMSDCRKLREGIYAGRNAVQWRYRGARRRGPGGSDAGSMWLDAQTGLVLAYDAEGTGRNRPSWDVLKVQYKAQPDAVFAPGPAEPRPRRG
ncbi:hypothetical protein ACFFGH_01715 [Lysobacter korlensis]|uniref:MucB/RseB N-terminal domain-containing protein n=1 Tax=Lysobacter korlensis TaxID=553636 RepID=A0ABV6RKS1_9GAMM